MRPSRSGGGILRLNPAVSAQFSPRRICARSRPGLAIRGTVTLSGSDVAVIHPPAELGVPVANGNAGEWVLVVGSSTRTFALEVDAIGELIDVRDRDIRDGSIQLRINGRPYGRAKTLFDPDDL